MDENTENNIEPKKKKTLEEIDDEFETKLQKIKSEISDVFKIDEYNLVEENMTTISKLHTYISQLSDEKRNGVIIERLRIKVHGTLYEKFKTGPLSLTKYEIDEWINKSSDYQRIYTYSEQQKIIIDYLTKLTDSLKQKLYALKNIQELKKMSLG